MNKRLLLTIAAAVMGLAVWSAGPVGHVVIAGKTMDGIRGGSIKAPQELVEALRHPDARRHYSGGAVGPDVAEGASHYGKTGDLARSMLENARDAMRAATRNKDPEAFAKARNELAFAYGWMSHMAADLNIHPKVNARVGDTYRFNNGNGKKIHALAEAQLAAYLRSLPDGKKYVYDVAIPYEALSRASGVSVKDLKAGAMKLRAKAAAEIGVAGKVTVDSKLKNTWFDVIVGANKDNTAFMNNPNAVENWDLDCGRIGTEDFDSFRKMVVEANGGKLPANWGSMYMTWWEAVKNLRGEDRMGRLKQLLGRPGGSAATTTGKTSSSKAPATGMWVLVEVQGKDENQSPDTCKARFTDTGFTADVQYKDRNGKEHKFSVDCRWTAPPGTLKPGSAVAFSGTKEVDIEVGQNARTLARGVEGKLSYKIPDGSAGARLYITFGGTSVAGNRRLVWDTRAYAYEFVPAGKPMPDPGSAKRVVTEAKQ